MLTPTVAHKTQVLEQKLSTSNALAKQSLTFGA